MSEKTLKNTCPFGFHWNEMSVDKRKTFTNQFLNSVVESPLPLSSELIPFRATRWLDQDNPEWNNPDISWRQHIGHRLTLTLFHKSFKSLVDVVRNEVIREESIEIVGILECPFRTYDHITNKTVMTLVTYGITFSLYEKMLELLKEIKEGSA